MSLRIQVLGSSSAGNCTVAWEEGGALMVDCGFGPRYVARHLERIGLSFSSLAGLVITHTHRDHIHEATVGRCLRERVPVCCPEQIGRHLKGRYAVMGMVARAGLLKTFRTGKVALGPFEVEAFEVPHDSPGGCFGYRIGSTGKSITVATDLGYADEHLVPWFADSDAIVIESNHDPDMLEKSGRPEWLRRRIREIGHLSNEQSARFVLEVMKKSTRPPGTLVLAHISQQCNTNALAVACMEDSLAFEGFAGISVVPTHKAKPSRVVDLSA